MIKKTLKIISAALCFPLIFCSCSASSKELSHLMIIQGIGIDIKDEGVYVTVEILNNEQSGSPGGTQTSDNKTKIYTSKGKTVASALRYLTLKSGNSPLLAHNRVIVLGENAANKRLSNLLDFFVRNYDSRVSELVCVAKGMSAEKLLRANLLKDTVKSEILENMLNQSAENSLIPKVRVIDIVNGFKNETDCIYIPAVALAKNNNNEDYQLQGCCVFQKDETFSGYLSIEESRGIAFLDNKINKGFFSCKLYNGENANFVINNGKTKYEIYEENGRLIYKLKVKLSCDLEEVEGSKYFGAEDDLMVKLKTAGALEIGRKMENTFIKLQEEHYGDLIRFGKRLRLYDKNLYMKYKDDWQSNFRNIECSAEVNITIRRIGEETFQSKKYKVNIK